MLLDSNVFIIWKNLNDQRYIFDLLNKFMKVKKTKGESKDASIW